MSTLAERLTQTIKEANLTKAELTRRAGLKSQSTVGELCSGNIVHSPQLPKIAAALGVNVLWLQHGTGPKHAMSDAELHQYEMQQHRARMANLEEVATAIPHSNDYAEIQQFSANGACGDGYMNDHVEVRGKLAFKRDWLAKMKINPESCSVIYARGESMWPTLSDGEVLLVDSSQREPMSSKVYVINVDGDLRVKRLFRKVSGWVVVSDNPDKVRYPDEELRAISDLQIVGRVVYRGGGI